MSRFRRRRPESDRHTWLTIDDRQGAGYLGTPPIVMNSMAGQEEHVYSLDHRGRRTQSNSTADGQPPALRVGG
jgi:hypothetical protein